MTSSILTDNRVRLGIITFLHFTVDFYGGIRTPLPEPTLVNHLQVSFGDVAILIGLAGIIINAIQPISGALLPGRGFPKLLIIGPVLASLAVLIGLTSSYWGVGALLFTSAIGIGILHPEGMLAAHSLSGARQGLGMAIYLSGGFFGFSLGGLVGGTWASAYNLSGFWLLAIPGLLAAVLVVLTGLHKLEGHAESVAPEIIRHTIPFALVFILCVFVGTSVYLFTYFITPYLVRLHGDQAQKWGGMAIFLFGISGALGSYLWGHMSDRHGRCRIIAIAQACALPLLYGLLTAESIMGAVLFALLMGIFLGSTFPLAVVLARGCPGGKSRFRAGLVIGGSWGLASITVMTFGKWYVDSFPPSSVTPMLHALQAIAVSVVVVVILAAILNRREIQKPVPAAENHD